VTDKPTPTDAELKALWKLHAADIGGIFYYARAVLTKWGQPAPARADSVQEDAARLDYLHSMGSTLEMLPGEVDFYPMRFRVGGLRSAVSPNAEVTGA